MVVKSFLEGISGQPYTYTFSTSPDLTVALYTIPVDKHFPRRGHSSFFLQLHPFGTVLVPLMILLLWALMMELMFPMQL